MWWPPVALDPDWIRAHRDAADLLHVHFGTESFPPGHLTACLSAAREARWPVVFTVHDLDHPQLSDPAAYHAQLEEIVPAADAVVTLTAGAARRIRDRWGREASVIPHPAVLAADAPLPRVRREPAAPFRVGVHLKDLRPNVDGPATVRALSCAADELRAAGVEVVGEVRLHRSVRDETARDRVRALCAASDALRLIEHERLSDDELNAALAGLDACVLPYRHGTHSGWLELCWDLGVPIAAPELGHFAEQHDDGSVRSFAPGDARALAAALAGLAADGRCTRAGTADRAETVADRRRRRARTDAAAAEAHADLYRRLIGRAA